MELWDLYDEQRRLVGTNHLRGQELPDNCFHLVVHVWIKNSQGQYLISQRAADRPTYPLLWEQKRFVPTLDYFFGLEHP